MTIVATRAAPARPLTERSATDLAHTIRTGALTSRVVVQAHIERLQADRRRINAIAADRFEAALADADAADRRVAEASGPDDLPPLLGVPCTIKESIALAGMPNCAGLLSRREHRATETATTAQRLIDAGAIPLGVTNTSDDDGVPLGVQVAAGCDRDHVAIAVALALERSLGGWVPPRA